MCIQKCENCGTKFEYKALLKSLWSDKTADCINCGASHETRWSSRFAIPAIIMLPLFIKYSISDWATLNRPLIYLVYLVYFIIFVALSPYIIKYKLKDSNNKNTE